MCANNAAAAIISAVKKSNLNYYIQESPFSLVINIRKTFVKNKDGHILYPPPPSDTTDDTNEEKVKIKKLERETSNLGIQLEKAKAENLAAYEKVKKFKTENESLKKKNDEIQENIYTLKSVKDAANKTVKSKEKELASLKVKNNNIEEEIKNLERKNIELKEKLELKDDETRKLLDGKVKIEEKMESLLDILYGCHECGLCACECDKSIMEDCVTSLEPSTPSAIPSETSHHPPQPGSTSYSWSPPPTPPCDSCGRTNFGPCPSSVCFACIPPLQIESELNTSSPSRTPPGTPPLVNRKDSLG